MGLLDFATSMGKKLFDSDDEAPDKIKAPIEQDNPGVKDLKLDFSGANVRLSGSADSAQAMQKAVLIAGNTQRVCDVDVSGLATAARYLFTRSKARST